ncbi:hypothetical protein MLD38_008268 [Melastoma candidum]|uniref:Uncharacterized protein n=1 Tax=Melastoma candidum TaxID=119954 RepID=A0ACB9RTG8_9MYRT|nr:hypothetical protein MLD38_008268 [Melastoma candidum]
MADEYVWKFSESWNGINTGARIQSSESDWWFEEVSYLSMYLFENLAATLLYYARKYLPGLGKPELLLVLV